jgi:hypothetical protein
MIVRRDFLDHWKTRRLRELLGCDHVSDHLIALWAHCETSKTSSFSCDEEQMARICRYTGNDYKGFVQAMIKARFIDQINGHCVAHDWSTYNRRLVHNWEAGLKGGRPPDGKRNKYKRITSDVSSMNEKPI